ncbi:MAG: acetate kinase [Kiritimatiellae bacterium]|nr:acetate kinase [Kiritimatiellia bacterium]
MKKQIRKVLVINSGSSSLKYQLFDMVKGERIAKGLVERIGCGGPKDHTEALANVVAELGNPKDIDAIGHRVLHGGEIFKESVKVTAAAMKKMKSLVKFGPLHMPANLGGIEACERIFKGVPNVAVFDTAFHQTMPDCAAQYAIDPKYYKKMGIRKYGFHGTSHKFIVQEAARLLKKPVSKVNLVTCHMGNGSSLAAVKNGECVDTSMGLTPLAGMVMGTRCGDIDAAAVLAIMAAEKLTPAEADTLLNKKSGLLALTGSSDCRDICTAAEKGDKMAELALEMLAYRTAFYIGGYNTVVGGADAIVMTGGIGENSKEVRERIVGRLGALGIKLDKKANAKARGVVATISAKGSKIPVVIIPTNEELAIAQDTVRILKG